MTGRGSAHWPIFLFGGFGICSFAVWVGLSCRVWLLAGAVGSTASLYYFFLCQARARSSRRGDVIEGGTVFVCALSMCHDDCRLTMFNNFHVRRANRRRKATTTTTTTTTGSSTPVTVATWKGMGLGELGLYRLTRPAPLLVVLTLLAGFSGVAGECKVDSCLRKYQTALESLVGSAMESAHSEDPGSTEARCIALRTYLNCISNVRRGCFGNIKYHSIKNTIESKMTQRKCAAKGDIFTGAANGGGRQQPPIPTDSVCAFKGKSVYKHCGLFGDPHLRTFNHEFQTCKIRGAWPLVHNEHLTVQVTNNPVITDGSATATSMLTVMIKKNEECASDHFVTFEAQADNLPGSFYDGRTEYGPGRSVELIEVDPGKHVQIYIKYIDTTILVRQIGRYFTFAIRMPEEIVNRRSAREEDVPELCVKGCPKTEQIDYKEFLAQKDDQLREYKSRNKLAMSRDDAESLCRDAQLVDFYFDSCVFDLMTTGDNNFTKAADTALQDLLKLTPELARTNQNRTTLKKYDEQYSDATRSRTTIFITFVCIIFSSYLL